LGFEGAHGAPVADEELAVASRRQFGVVSDDCQGDAVVAVEGEEDVFDQGTGDGVEVPVVRRGRERLAWLLGVGPIATE